MSILQYDVRAPAEPRVHDDVQRARVDAAAWCSCTATFIPAPMGEVPVLRVAGEVDLHTIAGLQEALTSGLERRRWRVLVDLAELSFCSVGVLHLLVQGRPFCRGQGVGYSVTAPGRVDRAWRALWPVGELPTRYPTAAAGLAAVIAGQVI